MLGFGGMSVVGNWRVDGVLDIVNVVCNVKHVVTEPILPHLFLEACLMGAGHS